MAKEPTNMNPLNKLVNSVIEEAEIMEMALKKQEPNQEKIRQEMIRQNEINVMRNSQLRANLRLVAA